MSPEFTPESYPPFPEDLPSVELETISLLKLQSNDEEEQHRMFEICQQQGFFYLDFSGTSAASLPQESAEVGRLAEKIFKLPLHEKQQYRRPSLKSIKNLMFGYKAAGKGVTDGKGTKDTGEFFNISKNDMLLSNPTLPWPAEVLSEKPFLASYMTKAHSTGMDILSILTSKLGLPSDACTNLHRLHAPSADHVRLTRGPARLTPDLPEIQTSGHTDFGTVTLLFNWLGGLQIWSEPHRGHAGFANVVDPTATETQAKWLWVRPKPNHAIVNLGDAAVKFTNGIFCSGRHRVVPAPGDQGLWPRYSVVYFVRPEDDAVLAPLKGSQMIDEAGRRLDREESERGGATRDTRELSAVQWIAEQLRELRGETVRLQKLKEEAEAEEEEKKKRKFALLLQQQQQQKSSEGGEETVQEWMSERADVVEAVA